MRKMKAKNLMRHMHGGILLLLIGILFLYLLQPDIYELLAAKMILIISISVILPLLLSWLIYTGWYYVWYRYAALWAAKLCGILARKFKTNIVKVSLLLFLLITLLEMAPQEFTEPLPELIKAITVEFFLKILGLIIILKILFEALKLRKRIVMLQFEDFTGIKDLKTSAQGISRRLANRLTRLADLLKTIDEINPKAKEKLICATVRIEDVGESLNNFVIPDYKIKIASFIEIPVGALTGSLFRLLMGPKMGGSLHKKGNRVELIAYISGKEQSGSWGVTSEDLDEKDFTLSDPEKIEKITDQLAYRIFTDLTKVGTHRWKAVQYFTEGLCAYRQTLKKEKDKHLYLRKAEEAFIAALNEDNKFVMCHYNLGIVYRDLGQYESAEAAFREALKEDHQNIHAYFSLSIHYYYKGNYDDALWYCEQAIRLTSIDARFWNLRGVVYDRMYEEMEEKNMGKMDPIIDNHRLYSFSIAAVLSWQKLFRSLLRVEDNQRLKNIARVCMSNLAMIHADKGARKSKCLFHQSISVSAGEGKPYYELGRFLFKREDFEEALSAFDKVYEEDSTCADKIVLWTLYLYACEKRIDKKKPGYERKLLCARYHLLNAIYENLWDFDVIPETKIKEISDRIKNSTYKSSKNLKDKDEYEDVEKEFVKLKRLTVEAVGKLFSLLIKEKLEGNKDKLEEEKDKRGKDEFAKNMGANMTKWLIKVMKMEEGESKQEKELKETMLKDMEKLISLLLEDVLKKNVDKSKFREDELVKKMMECLGKRILLLNSTERELNPKESKIKEEEKQLAMVQIYIFVARAVKELIEKFRSSEFKFVMDGVNKMLKEGEREIKKLEENHVNKIRMNLLHTFLAWSSIYTDNTRDTLFYARKAVAFDPESPDARAALSRVYFKMNNYDLAQKELENCLILNPKAQKILHFIPHIDKWDETLPRDSEKRRKTFESMAQFLENTLTQMKSRSPEKDDRKGFSDDLRTIYHTLGIFYRNLKKYDEAITRLKVAAALSASGDVQQTKIDLGWTYLEAGAYNKSEQTFQKLLNKLRRYEDSYKGIEDKGIAIRLGLAISIVERTVLADVDRNSAFYNRPLQLLDEVANHLERESLKKDYIWYNALYHECQGRIALKQGRTREATRCMEQSVSIMASPRVYYFLAEAYWMLSQEEKKTRRYLYLEKAREACALSRKCDKNDKYNLEVVELNKRITEALDRIYVPTPPKEEKKSA